jgi:hypothetical protein
MSRVSAVDTALVDDLEVDGRDRNRQRVGRLGMFEPVTTTFSKDLGA